MDLLPQTAPPPDRQPLWRRVEQSLHRDILSGTLASGARLPSEPELAQSFAVHRHTVRRAVAALASRGLLRIEQGRGTFVHDSAIDYVVGRRTRVEANLVGATGPSRAGFCRRGRNGHRTRP